MNNEQNPKSQNPNFNFKSPNHLTTLYNARHAYFNSQNRY